MQSKERPMLYSTDMVVSILEDRKTKTRRTKGLGTFNDNPDNWRFKELAISDHRPNELHAWFESKTDVGPGWLSAKCPYGQPGDLLWVRENGWVHNNYQPGLNDDDLAIGGNLFFQAGASRGFKTKGWIREHYCFFPSIHMYKIFARIWLQITDIKVERLEDITASDAISEGIQSKENGQLFKDYLGEKLWYFSPQASFFSLWASINGIDSWRANPWVWVISFKVLSTTGKPSTIPSGFQSEPFVGKRLKSSPTRTNKKQGTEALLLPGNGEGKEVANG